MEKKLVNPEIIEEVAETATVSPIRSFVSKPAVKYTGLVITGAIGLYGMYRLGKFLYGKYVTRRAAKNQVTAEESAPVEEAVNDNPEA